MTGNDGGAITKAFQKEIAETETTEEEKGIIARMLTKSNGTIAVTGNGGKVPKLTGDK